MKNILLKIIIVIAFIGIFVVSGILIIKNRNVEYMAYNTIKLKIEQTDFKGLSSSSRTVKESFDGSRDMYTEAVDAMVFNLNLSIDFYLDYLVDVKGVSRGEQDMLIEKYGEYSDAIKVAREALDLYHETYKRAEVEASIQKSITANNGNFVKAYVIAYNKGSDFFKNLVNIVNKYSHNGNTDYNYTEIYHHILNALGDNCVPMINENMDKRIVSGLNIEDVTTTKSSLNYLYFIEDYSYFYDNGGEANTNCNKFLLECREIDVVKLITQKSEYMETLNEEQTVKAVFVLNFLKTNYRVEL